MMTMEHPTMLMSYDYHLMCDTFECVCGWKYWDFCDYVGDELNDRLLVIGRHWIDDHDYDYDKVSRWVSDNWV